MHKTDFLCFSADSLTATHKYVTKHVFNVIYVNCNKLVHNIYSNNEPQ